MKFWYLYFQKLIKYPKNSNLKSLHYNNMWILNPTNPTLQMITPLIQNTNERVNKSFKWNPSLKIQNSLTITQDTILSNISLLNNPK